MTWLKHNCFINLFPTHLLLAMVWFYVIDLCYIWSKYTCQSVGTSEFFNDQIAEDGRLKQTQEHWYRRLWKKYENTVMYSLFESRLLKSFSSKFFQI